MTDDDLFKRLDAVISGADGPEAAPRPALASFITFALALRVYNRAQFLRNQGGTMSAQVALALVVLDLTGVLPPNDRGELEKLGQRLYDALFRKSGRHVGHVERLRAISNRGGTSNETKQRQLCQERESIVPWPWAGDWPEAGTQAVVPRTKQRMEKTGAGFTGDAALQNLQRENAKLRQEASRVERAERRKSEAIAIAHAERRSAIDAAKREKAAKAGEATATAVGAAEKRKRAAAEAEVAKQSAAASQAKSELKTVQAHRAKASRLAAESQQALAAERRRREVEREKRDREMAAAKEETRQAKTEAQTLKGQVHEASLQVHRASRTAAESQQALAAERRRREAEREKRDRGMAAVEQRLQEKLGEVEHLRELKRAMARQKREAEAEAAAAEQRREKQSSKVHELECRWRDAAIERDAHREQLEERKEHDDLAMVSEKGRYAACLWPCMLHARQLAHTCSFGFDAERGRREVDRRAARAPPCAASQLPATTLHLSLAFAFLTALCITSLC